MNINFNKSYSKISLELESEKYSFFKDNKDLKNIAYLTLSGSYGYGTNNENSDIDLRGFLIEDKKYLLGFNTFEQFEDIPTDTVIYGLKKFISLCSNSNPNTLELLGTEDNCIVIMNDAGKMIRDNSHLFLSKKVITSFGDYANAQFRRLSNALCHDSYDFNEQEKHLKNTLVSQISHFNNTYKYFGKDAINIYMDDTNQLLFDINLNNYPVRDFIGIYSEIQNTMKSYNKLNHRNRKKDDAHLYKHVMHLIRLLITGIDILDGKGIITNRKYEHEFLMDLRNGVYSFTDIFAIVDEYQQKFKNAAKNTKLSETPDYIKIENMMIKLYEMYL